MAMAIKKLHVLPRLVLLDGLLTPRRHRTLDNVTFKARMNADHADQSTYPPLIQSAI